MVINLMKTGKFSNAIPALVIMVLLLTTQSCYYYRVNKTTEPVVVTVQKSQDAEKYIILHLGDNAWHISDITIGTDSISGKAFPLKGHEYYKTTDPDKPNRYRATVLHDQKDVLSEVHIYATEMANTGTVSVSIPVRAITRIDIYDKARGATTASWSFSIFGAAAGAFAIVTGIVFLLKESCPFIYIETGDGYKLKGEIFSGAVQPGLERDDYLLLDGIKSSEGVYKIKMTNEVRERQMVNLAELWVYDDHGGKSILTDKNGIAYTVANPVSPLEARGSSNIDILPLVQNKDSLSYLGNEKENDPSGIENIILKFPRPVNTNSSKLIIRAKNSFWLDGLILKIHRLFGERYSIYSAKQEKASGDKLRKWSLDQKMPLSVYIQKNNRWEFVDYFNLAGPMTLKDDILPVNLEGIDSDTVKIKLETGFLFWEIDYAGMDFSKNEAGQPVNVPILSATDNSNINVRDQMLNNDSQYYVLDEVGDESILTFNVPEQKTGKRTVYLHTRGYYKILRDQTGPPDKKRLKTFRKPGSVPAYSKEVFDSLSD